MPAAALGTLMNKPVGDVAKGVAGIGHEQADVALRTVHVNVLSR